MATQAQTIPQPLNGEEIRTGIATRIAIEVPPEHLEAIKDIIYRGLGATCSLESSAGYSKFKADWELSWWIEKGQVCADWRVSYELDDFGRVTKGSIGSPPQKVPEKVTILSGEILEMPPDRFRRETAQPIPKPTELKQTDSQQITFSSSLRGQGKRRDV